MITAYVTFAERSKVPMHGYVTKSIQPAIYFYIQSLTATTSCANDQDTAAFTLQKICP